MARGASTVQRQLSVAHKQLIAATRALSGADSDAIKAAANLLRTAIRKQLSTQGSGRRTSVKTRKTYGGTPSAPGASPHLQSGKLRRSVKSGVVDGVRRVGTDIFYMRLLEKGVVADAKPARRSMKGHTVKGEFRTFWDSKQHEIKARRRLVIEPRPTFEPALASVKDKMPGVFAETYNPKLLQRLAAGGVSVRGDRDAAR